MIKNMINKIKEAAASRLTVIVLVFTVMFICLVYQVFTLQIQADASIAEEEDYKSEKLRDVKSTRGNIYDVNGKLLAYNTVSYSIVMEESGLLSGNAKKNEMIYKLVKLLDRYHVTMDFSFGLELDENGEIVFNVSDTAELRFKKNAYGRKSISDLTEEEYAASAFDVYSFMRYGSQRAVMFQISNEYELEDALKIMAVRYTLFSTVSGTQFTIASNVSEEVVVAIKENSADIPGVEIKQVTSRVYNESVFFAHIIGYTGSISTDEIETMNEQIIEENNFTQEDQKSEKGVSLLYNATDVIGKTGIEKSMELILSGTKGTQTLTVNQNSKILSQKTNTDPVSGQDIYLTIDADLQKACYYILERNLAAVLLSKLVDDLDYGTKGESASDILVPIYEVYYALLENRIINVDHFSKEDATELEQKVLGYYNEKQNSLFYQIRQILAADSGKTSDTVTEELQEYLSYVYSKALSIGLLSSDKIDTSDSVYREYIDNQISMSKFFQYAINSQWVNTSLLGDEEEWYSTEEWYDLFLDYLVNALLKDATFKDMIYHSLVFQKTLSGKEICLLLFDQNVIEYNESNISKLKNGKISAFQFMYDTIENLEITPGQIGLAPCSGSIVITDVNTGDLKALVTYPSYDNNMLANKINYEYYSTLLNSSAYPLMNRPTTQTTTTGSTFKPLSSLIGLGEGVITTSTKIEDKGIFEAVVPSPKCWRYPRSHGTINLTDALMHSCNYFFYEVGYRLMNDGTGRYYDSVGIAKIQKYAAMFGLTTKSGVEISEITPVVSNSDAVRTAIGYGHSFAPIHISRYITAIANEGIVYNLTLIDSIRDNLGEIITQNEASVYNRITMFTDAEWDAVKYGMYKVVNTSTNSLDTLYGNLGVSVAGKTGTAQISKSVPNNALFVCFAPYENPEISVTVVLPNGYKSANSAYIAREVLGLYFNNENKAALLSGDIKAGTVTSINVSD